MSELREISVNHLPSPTWNWLRVNEAYVKVPSEALEGNEIIEADKKIKINDTLDQERFLNLESGLGSEFIQLAESFGIEKESFKIADDTKVKEPVRIDISYSENDFAYNCYQAEIGNDSECTFIVNHIICEGSDIKEAACDMRFIIGKKSVVKLIQIHCFKDDMKFYNNVSCECAEDARFEVIHLELCGAGIYEGLCCNLLGDRSSLRIDTAYLAKNEDTLDFNYVARHRGKETKSNIYCNGVLKNSASKVFRGTIDFIKGCAGAVGDEKEDVLLIDEDVVNKTVPLILCAEEDVEGTHGATIGKLSDEVLFYFMARGIDEENAYKLMIDGRIAEVASKIEDEKTKDYIFGSLLKKEDEEVEEEEDE